MNLYFSLILLSIPSIAALFEPVARLFSWNRYAIEHFQWWRILSGNFAHTNFDHFAMNILALWIIAYIFRPRGSLYLKVTLLTSFTVGLSLLCSSLDNYVGLSGALHGIFAYFAFNEALNGRKGSWLLVIGVIGKVVWEQTFGPSAYTQELIGARVAIQAHLAGLISGLVFSFIVWLYSSYKNRAHHSY
ncbi:rhombosortase [Vibrio viridaestus]|uniref:Rhombosortase n=1 Tax=Vibrio viridaestus TaxID=2487322 RepID=A0A3N9TIT5_9VIBR|nr:rhombosortase [Vibrio viridaestus]RQW64238.1 rhombosortase [Vibrio viridaestus]